MKQLILFLFVFAISCSHEKEIFENQEQTLNRPAPIVIDHPKPQWAEDSLMQDGDLRIAVAEDSVHGFAITVYDSIAQKLDTIGWKLFGVTMEDPSFGMRVLTQRDIMRWGLKNYNVGDNVMSIKVLCPVGNYSKDKIFAIQRDKGVPNAFLNDYDYPGLALQQVYKLSSDGYLDLYSTSDKTNWFFSSGRRFIDANSNVSDCDGSVIMCIYRRYFDSYYSWVTIPHDNGVPRSGLYLFHSWVNYMGYASKENQSNNWAAAMFIVDGTLKGKWINGFAGGMPRPVTIREQDIVRRFSGPNKFIYLSWGGTNNYYKVYKDGNFLGETRYNGFTHYFQGGYVEGTYTVVNEIKGVGETSVSIRVNRK